MVNTWIVVADGARARIFACRTRRSRPQEVADLTRPAVRVPRARLESDRPGRGRGVGAGTRHGMQPRTATRTRESGLFADEICALLDAQHQEYDGLVLICPPRFLGMLRKRISEGLGQKIHREVGKDLLNEEPAVIRRTAFG